METKHLKPETAAWAESIEQDYCLQEHHLRLLQLAAECWDQITDCLKVLAAKGPVYEDRFGQPKSRPEIAILRDGRTAFARLLRELNLDDGDSEAPRPPTIHHNS